MARRMIVARWADNGSGWEDQNGTEMERIDLAEWPITPDEDPNTPCAWCPGWFRNAGWFIPATGEHICGRHVRTAEAPDGTRMD